MAPQTPAGSTTAGPTMTLENMARQMMTLQATIARLEEENRNHAAARIRDAGEVIKPNKPGPFDGTPGTLQGFLTQLNAYFLFYPTQITGHVQKVILAGGCLSGIALDWFEPIMRDYLDNDNENDRDSETQRIFGDYQQFVLTIKATFGTIDEERDAEQKLGRLHQTKSVSEYAASFRQITSKLDYDDEPLMMMFYRGLKTEVKDELYKEDRPDNIAKYIAMAVQIDNRQWERRVEKQHERRGNTQYTPSRGWNQRQVNQGRKQQ